MDSDNDSYHSENEFYYPDEENVLQENKTIVNTSTRRKKTAYKVLYGRKKYTRYLPP